MALHVGRQYSWASHARLAVLVGAICCALDSRRKGMVGILRRGHFVSGFVDLYKRAVPLRWSSCAS